MECDVKYLLTIVLFQDVMHICYSIVLVICYSVLYRVKEIKQRKGFRTFHNDFQYMYVYIKIMFSETVLIMI